MEVKFFFVKDIQEYAFLANKIKIPKDIELKTMEIARTKTKDEAKKFLYEFLIKANDETFFQGNTEIFEGELHEETGIAGLKFDFNYGLRLDIPPGNFHVKISDFDSEQVFFDEDISNVRLISSDDYYIHWQIEIFHDGEKVFEHIFNPENREVLIYSRSPAMGDNLALLPYIEQFRRVHNCKVKMVLPPYLRELTSNLYPEIEQVEFLEFDYYATFYTTIATGNMLFLPEDPRTIPLDRLGRVWFGLKKIPPLPTFTPTKRRKIKKPYVCIAVQASSTFKGWHWPGGWDIVVDYLKKLGYQVLCIDAKKIQTNELNKQGILTIEKPKGAENFTGELPLIERANMLYYADFFIGVSSGLAWVAHYAGCPVVLISGFTQDWNEFYTPYRIANRFVCNGCYNDVRLPHMSDKVCPRYAGTPRELECQKKISPRQVIQAIDQLIKDKNLLERNGWNEQKK